MMRRLSRIGLLALVLTALIAVPVASADPGGNNPQVQYRTFSCDDGNTYNAGFVSPVSGNFFLVGSTDTFAIKVFTEVFPSGETKTFNYGIPGFDPSSLVTCSYTDPEGVLNVFSGFFTPRS
jgi:hypothetical protein